MSQQPAYTGGLTPQQSAMAMDATAQPEQQAYGMVNRLLGSTQADAFANRDKNAAYNMIANHPALGQAQADAFMNRGTVNRQPDYYGLGVGITPGYQDLKPSDEYYLNGMWSSFSKKPGADENRNMYADRPAPNLGAGRRMWTPEEEARPSGIVGNALMQMLPPDVGDMIDPGYQEMGINKIRRPQTAAPGFFEQISTDAAAAMNQRPWNKFIDDVTAIGTNAAYQNNVANANVPSTGTIDDGRGASEAARGGAWGGIQGNPFYMGERPAPGHQLGYIGSFMGGSRGWTDDSEGRAWDARAARNIEINRMLGNQDIARNANATDALRTMLNVEQHREASKDRATNSFWSNLEKTPPGDRAKNLRDAEARGLIPKEIAGPAIIADTVKAAARGNTDKEGKVVKLREFLASLQSRFDPKTMDGSELIRKFQEMGIDPNQISALQDDPVVGGFAKSVLGPPVISKGLITRGVESIADYLFGK